LPGAGNCDNSRATAAAARLLRAGLSRWESFNFQEFAGMVKSIYVGNIPFGATEDEIRNLFAQYGEVQSIKFINDRETGRFRGFGFVEMGEEDAKAAITALNGTQMGGRSLRINEAQERGTRPPRRNNL
jgi:RNA recognition motif-containing protein